MPSALFAQSGLFIALNALLLVALAGNVSRLRMSRRIPYGDGGDKDMNQAIRTHANGVEHVTIFCLTILALEGVGGGGPLLAGLGWTFTASRVVHAYGMLARSFQARRLGAGLTYVSQATAAMVLIKQVLAP